MAVAASYSSGDLTSKRLLRPIHPRQSILPLRRERTHIDGEFSRVKDLNPTYSNELPDRSVAFSGEKQYDRRHISAQLRSAKSDEIFRLIDRRLQTGVHGVRLMFRANDPNQEGKLSKEAFRRVLMQLCGYINNDEWEKVCRLFHLNERDGTITFEEFLSYFPDNDKVRRELSASKTDQVSSSLVTVSQNIYSGRNSTCNRYLPKLTANYCLSLMKSRCQDPSFTPQDYLPTECLNDGVIIRETFKKILENFQLDDIIQNENEFQKLWSKIDLDNTGLIRTNVFLRLLDYRVNLADEINADIRKLASRSSTARMIDRKLSSSSTNANSLMRNQRRSAAKKVQEKIHTEEQIKHSAPPPTALDRPEDEPNAQSEMKPMNEGIADTTKDDSLPAMAITKRDASSKYRILVQQHRKLMKQLTESDEFVPYLDRKVNEGYFCLKTVFSYLDPNQTNYITKEQLIAALGQFDIVLSSDKVDQFLQKHHCITRTVNAENMIDYNSFLKCFQDRSDSSFLARTLSAFSKDKSNSSKSDFHSIEHGIIDLLHHVFLSITAAFKFISSDINDLCPEKEFFVILKKELAISDNYRFTEKQKHEIYILLNCTENMKQKRQIPYKRLLHVLSKTTIPTNKERHVIEKKGRTVEKPIEPCIQHKQEEVEEEEEKPTIAPRSLSYIEKALNDLIRLRMHTFTKVFSRIDQPRTDKINKEQFYHVLQQMDTDLTEAEVNMIWSSSGFPPDKNILFANLIRQLIEFNREENQHMLHQLRRSELSVNRLTSSVARSGTSASTRTIPSSRITSELSSTTESIDYHEVYDRILPYIRKIYNKIKAELLDNDPLASGLIDFSTLGNIFHHHSIPINNVELSALVRLDNPHNGSKVQYPFFIRKYHPDGPIIKISPWTRVHPVYEQLIQKQHAKHPIKEIYDQRTQNPRDLKYLIRLFNSYDKRRKGFLTNDEFYSLLHDNGINLNKSDEDYYQLFSKYDRQLRDQFNYTDLFRTLIYTIMS